MENFFKDNEDILFHFGRGALADVAPLQEDRFSYANDFDFAPKSADEAVENYRGVMDIAGELAGGRIAQTAADTDAVGNVLNADGTVTYAPGIAKAMKLIAQAGLSGFTLPYKYGGLNLPTLLYVMSIDVISRADASLMNMYGLQGIAETINAFADDEIKDKYLPKMASGEWSGAMALTEPDAGSDLQSVKTRAWQNEAGEWFVTGVKRFITNGCGDVLVVLARTEEGSTDGRGLSCLVVEKGPRVKVRRLENKLGIHGSPTCELVFDDAPAKLIGQRQRGLITYVMALMNGARIGIAAQGLGIGEAALRAAREYAAERRQFGSAICDFPAIRELLDDMDLELRAARSLTYFAAKCVDMERGYDKVLALHKDSPEAADWRKAGRVFRNFNKMLTPMAKYFSSEMAMKVSNDAISVLGGSGYMKDYPVERLFRDARITSIYEGTSQLQVLAAVSGVVGGMVGDVCAQIGDTPSEIEELAKAIEAVKNAKDDPAAKDRHARRLVDMGIHVIVQALFNAEGRADLAARWREVKRPLFHAKFERISNSVKAQ